MKITKVSVLKSFQDNGIEDIKMDKLGKIVLIAGKNGSGKSRLLNKISQALSSKVEEVELGSITTQISQLYADIARIESELPIERQKHAELKDLADEAGIPITTPFNNAHPKRREVDLLFHKIQTLEDEIFRATNRIAQLKNYIDEKIIETDKSSNKTSMIFFVPKNLYLDDSRFLTKSDLMKFALGSNTIGVDIPSQETFAKIQYVQDLFFNSTHQDFQNFPESAKAVSAKDFETLNTLVKSLLNTSIDRDLEGNATLFGLPLGTAKLSDGQKILLQFCIAIFNHEFKLANTILAMDEPENHLHPSVIIEIVDRISKYVRDGQIWIATHSIPLLAHFDANSIWYMEKGKISHAGKIPEKVLEGLLGNKEEIGKLQDFIGLPHQLALNRFTFECLFEPHAVLTGKNDPQILQIKNQIGKFNEKVKILDYGAGKGRLLANIIENSGDNLQEFTEKINYIAYDEFDVDKGECEALLDKIYGSDSKRYFNNFENLHSYHKKSGFDIIVMSNVLHEIDPIDWLKLFSKDGDISSCLKDDGVLVLVEDTQIPVGEKAHRNGFIVLSTPQLNELFNMERSDFVDIQTERKDRLQCHVIPKRYLEQITPNSRISALKSVRDVAKAAIVRIRKDKINYDSGKLLGFYLQQFANASLALPELTVT